MILFSQNILLGQTTLSSETDTYSTNVSTVNGNAVVVSSETVPENLDLIKKEPSKKIESESVNASTFSGMTLIYIDGKPVYTKTQSTGKTTLSIIYVPN